jgi:NAD(P)-dependent dehydrogenase (short-subunit alcohol dehydrogenase family)
MKLNGKVAWIVGASGGIGAAVARELARRGATVAISARREDRLREVSGGDMLVLPVDITDAASVAGYRGLAGAEAYGATKAAQINLLESLRVHLARTGAGHHRLPWLRADRSHGPQPLPHAVHHRGRPGRTVHLRRPRTRAHRDRLPRGWPC